MANYKDLSSVTKPDVIDVEIKAEQEADNMTEKEALDKINDTEDGEIKVIKRGKKPGRPRNIDRDLKQKKDEHGTRYLRMALEAWDLPPVDINNPKEVAERIRMYFQICMENDVRPQIVGLANWLGVKRSTLMRWRTGASENAEAVDKAYMILEDLWANWMLSAKINPVSGIFLAKTWFGYREQTEYIVTPGDKEMVATEDLIAEAKMLPQVEQIEDKSKKQKK